MKILCVGCVLVVFDYFGAPWTAAHQAPLSMGFSRQEYRSGLPFPSPGDLPSIYSCWSWSSNTPAAWWRADSLENTLMLGKIEGRRRRGATEDDGWMAPVTPWTWVWANSGRGDRQGSLACCSPWGRKELDTTWQLNNNKHRMAARSWNCPRLTCNLPNIGFLPFEGNRKLKVAQSCLTLCNPTDYIVHAILQASILEWGK